MALKTIMLRRSIDKKKEELEQLRAKDQDFQIREAELEKAIDEANTPEEATKALSDAVMNLGKEIGIDMNFQSVIPDEENYMAHLEQLGYLAYEDQCTPCNPREPMVADMIQIMKDAYKGN